MSPGRIEAPATALQRERDQAMTQKFHAILVSLVNSFNAQNREAAHPIMVATMHVCAQAGRLIGMQRGDFVQYAAQIFDDQGKARPGGSS